MASSPAILASMMPLAAKLRKRYTALVGFDTPPDDTTTSRGTAASMHSCAHVTTPSRSTFLALEVFGDGGVAQLEAGDVEAYWGRSVGHIFSGYKAPPSTLQFDCCFALRNFRAEHAAIVTPGAVRSS